MHLTVLIQNNLRFFIQTFHGVGDGVMIDPFTSVLHAPRTLLFQLQHWNYVMKTKKCLSKYAQVATEQ